MVPDGSFDRPVELSHGVIFIYHMQEGKGKSKSNHLEVFHTNLPYLRYLCLTSLLSVFCVGPLLLLECIDQNILIKLQKSQANMVLQ